ncbi:MAG: gamma-glutamyltransferase [Candidatus Aminicenantes bacterium]|jgi:gamma-glutamyltranspeptidase/glutathione hydrolase
MNVGQIESGFCPSADGKAAEALKGMVTTAAPEATEAGDIFRPPDLALIPWPIIPPPLKRKFRGATVYTMPLPAAARTLLFTLSMLDHLPLDTNRDMDDDNKKIHLLAEVLRKAFLERSDRPFDRNFYPQLVKKDMLRRKYARQSIREILKNVDKTILSTIAGENELSGETTHLSTMDNKGMAVSLTRSIERVYSSKAAAAGLGFLYNNYLMDYEYSLVNHMHCSPGDASAWKRTGFYPV